MFCRWKRLRRPADYWQFHGIKDQYDTYFLKIENCKFKQKVVPGDTLILKMETSSYQARNFEMKGTIFVGDKLVAEAILVHKL